MAGFVFGSIKKCGGEGVCKGQEFAIIDGENGVNVASVSSKNDINGLSGALFFFC